MGFGGIRARMDRGVLRRIRVTRKGLPPAAKGGCGERRGARWGSPGALAAVRQGETREDIRRRIFHDKIKT